MRIILSHMTCVIVFYAAVMVAHTTNVPREVQEDTVSELSSLGIYSHRQACAEVGVSTSTLSRWSERGFVPKPLHWEGLRVFTENQMTKIREFAKKWPEIRKQERANRLRIHYVREALKRPDLV